MIVRPPYIRLEQVELRHDRLVAVQSLSGLFPPGSMTAVAGPNGGGKTTLLQALAGLHPPSAGGIDRGGLRPADVAMLPQGSQLDRRFPLSCRDVVALGFTPRIGPFARIDAERIGQAEAALATVGLAEAGTRPIGALSAGQFQRVLFARLMVQDASVLLLDEPFTAMDAATEDHLLDLLHVWQAEGRTIIVVLHDLDLVRVAFPYTLLLAKTGVAWGPTDVTLTEANCRQAGLIRCRRIQRRRSAA